MSRSSDLHLRLGGAHSWGPRRGWVYLVRHTVGCCASLMAFSQFSQGLPDEGIPDLMGEPSQARWPSWPTKDNAFNLSMSLEHFQVFSLPKFVHGTTLIKKPSEVLTACKKTPTPRGPSTFSPTFLCVAHAPEAPTLLSTTI